MKHYITKIALFSLCLGLSTAKAAPFMAVGDNAELFVTAGALLSSDDNIYLGASGKSDTIYSFTPGLDLVFGKGSAVTGDVYYNEEIRRYSSQSKQNVNLATVGTRAAYSNGVSKADFNASYAEIAQNQVGATLSSDIARRNVTNLSGKTEFGLTEKTSLSIGLAYDKVHYVPVAFTSSDVLTIPVDVYFKATPKLDWSAGYSYRSTALSGSGDDSRDSFFNIGARGEFTPKLTGQVRVGYTARSFDRAGSQSLVGLSGGLTYAYSEKTSVLINASNDFGNSGTGDSTKNLSFGASIANHLSEQWALNAGLSWRSTKYPTRTDDYVEGSIGATYSYNAYLNFNANYIYRDNSSNMASAGTAFTNNVFSLGASVRY
ncbi:outer membrane beta-barrel protein [Opitutus sp. GAS368]|jgi:hypothetical protein|uniref:outer membrane beta-barrel protein n=1 Tax=Opitutus sp. GAS368 TaxID=1882749 RepID=UPI00087B14E8|nr:outer membrane beta-barrel protein [Opitutus sp. GAS368]SDR85858.1 Putative beta-barrel porin 2 [Opitutus sp. GAS368]